MDHKQIIDNYYANIYSSLPVVLTKGKGIYVWDTKGRKFFDCLSCYSAVNQGHRHPKIIRAAKKQMDRITLTSMAFYNDKLAEFLEVLKNFTYFDKFIMKNSGAEAVEVAIKAMRRWGSEVRFVEKPKIIVMNNNFHGRTSTIVGFSSDKESRKGFGPFSEGFISIPFGSINELKKTIEENRDVVGVLLEPVQGEAGVIIPPVDYVNSILRICKNNNILVALDEIQTGLGRTGFMYNRTISQIIKGVIQNFKPDISILGKALSGGVFPISVCCMSERVAKVFRPGSDGSTYGGNPLACAVGIAAVNVLIDEQLDANSARMGAILLERLRRIVKENEMVKDVRGKGLLIAVEFKEPIAKLACSKLIDKGILAKDTHGKIIRFAPPLTISRKELDKLSSRLEEFFYEFTY